MKSTLFSGIGSVRQTFAPLYAELANRHKHCAANLIDASSGVSPPQASAIGHARDESFFGKSRRLLRHQLNLEFATNGTCIALEGRQ